MTSVRNKIALSLLQWALGAVILIEAILFVMPAARLPFAQTHMHDALRLLLGWGEIVGCVLLLVPRTVVCGTWLLSAVFSLAIVIHLLHGMYDIGNLVIYIAAAVAIAAGKEQ